MLLAYFSPLNPQPSGISDYSEELLPYLAAGAEITLFVDGFVPANPEIRARFTSYDYRHNPSVLQTLHDYDAIVYHLGNDHRYHAGMLAVAREHPGIVVFHDFALQDFFLGLAQAHGRVEVYLEEVLACHGKRVTREAAEALERGSTPPQVALPLEFPLNCRIANSAEAIIVHSEWARARFAALAPSVPVSHINMPILPSAIGHTVSDSNGTGASPVQIANFGLITPGKGIEQALRALADLKADHNFHYTLVGEANAFFDVRALVREYDMDSHVTITGHLPLREFESRIAATDIALNLRERTVGETSASLCRIMAAGVPAIVYNVGAFSELPNDAVVKIDQDQNADALLEAYLRRLIEDAVLRRRLGENARRYITEHHDIETAAANYLALIRQVIAARPRKQLLGSVANEIFSLGVRVAHNESFLTHVAKDVATLIPTQVIAGTAGVSPADVAPGSTLREKSLVEPTGKERAQVGVPGGAAPPGYESRLPHPEIMQVPATTDSPGRLPKIAGIDYKQAALEYPHLLDAERSHYLRTKPFYNLANKPDKHLGDGMDAETHRHFTDFANMAKALALPAGARILDVGCGSGWLSEYFARLGYDVTGIDISDELIAMARERLERIPYDVDHETRLRCRFLVQDIETASLAEKFDAVVCYDSLHHFEDERKVFRQLSAMLDLGGLLFILEGHKPAAGSATEEELQDVMRRYGTLESPFSGDYLRTLLNEQGLAVVGDYVSVNGLFEREMLEDNRLPLRSLATDYHYLTCIKVADGAPASGVPDSRNPGVLRAEFTLLDPPPRQVNASAKLNLALVIRNSGDTLWLNGQTLRAGVVMPGVRVINDAGEIVSEVHGNPMLPRAMVPGQSVAIDVPCPVPSSAGTYTVKIDLVDQHVCWFEARGSQPLSFTVEVIKKA
ncbi:MAG TPA: methyltransferase domain-containing protein [Pyrinomonadaceae bacterium]|jgi:2-polyprenyl-3-methyl-5-hydroxy-6-metoxy-1,4-benzoquinol methylase/glycosyltransferase involved in cell wall biosynthesis|nr:methyltransferase domain-containing protein [Pyrinomonadaceae bacterium]